MPREVILDVETKKSFSQLQKRDPARLGVSYVGIYTSWDKRLFGFFEKELSQLWPFLEEADRTIGFNINKFDFPVLAPYYSGDLTTLPVFDLLEAVKETLGFRIGLDRLAMATLGSRKSGSGWDALRFYANNELDKLAKYCQQDVVITRDLYYHALKNGVLKYPDDEGNFVEFKITIPAIKKDALEGVQKTLEF